MQFSKILPVFGLALMASFGVSVGQSKGTGGNPDEPIVTYSVPSKIVGGLLPITEAYEQQVVSPSNFSIPGAIGWSVTVDEVPPGVDPVVAKNFVTLSSPTLFFDAPSQARSVIFTTTIPDGFPAGVYAYTLITTGWEGRLDPNGNGQAANGGAAINLTVFPAISNDPPAVAISNPGIGQVFTYTLGTSPVVVPISISGTGSLTAPVTALTLEVDGVSQTLTSVTALPAAEASGQVSLSYTTAGTRVVRATATNSVGTSTTSSEFTIEVVAPPPTVAITQPADGSVFDLTLGSTLSIPLTVTANSLLGGISSVTSTLNGSAVVGFGASGLGTLNATGSAGMVITQPGTYTLNATAINSAGQGTASPVSFTVKGIVPPPSITLVTPGDGLVVHRFADDPPSVINYSFVALTDYGVVDSVSVTFDGQPLSPTLTGAGTADVGGVGSFSTSVAGTHVITASMTSNGLVASDSATITVVVDPKPPVNEPCGVIDWLVPVVLNKSVEGGSTVPVKFRILCGGAEVVDPEVVIAVFEVFADGSTSTPVLFPWGDQPNDGTYKYTGNKYHLDYVTADGVHTYRVEVYRPATPGGLPGLLDYREINTFERGKTGKSEKSSKSSKSDKSCKDDKSDKSKKSAKSEKKSKSGKK